MHVAFGADIPPVLIPSEATNPIPMIADAVRRAAPGAVVRVIVSGDEINDPQLTRAALDAIAPDNPLRVASDAGHAALLNTAALQALHVTTPRDGWLFENDWWRVERKETEAQPDEVIAREIARYSGDAAHYGVTTLQITVIADRPHDGGRSSFPIAERATVRGIARGRNAALACRHA